MARRLPASMRTRQNLSELIEGRLSSSAGRSELVKLAARLIIEEALGEESRDALGRDYYERGSDADRGYRNGVREGRLKTAISEIGARLWADYQEFCRRDLGEHEIIYLFVDGIAERIHVGQKREPVLAAWGIATDGKKVLLGLMAGSKEDAETVVAFFQDLRARGLGDPLLVVSDGAPGIIEAIETCFPRSVRQRCLAHRMRDLAAEVLVDQWPDFEARVQAVYQAPSRAIARDLAEGVVKDHEAELPSAIACFRDDLEACIAHLRLPITHRRAIRTTNLLERLFVEERRRLKIIPDAFGEKPVLNLMFGAMTRAAERWLAIKITTFERRQLDALRKELDHDCNAENGLEENRSAATPQTRISSSSRT